ncbi:glucose 1-dehydrogenase [Peribacillus psychrosaccharolyticus]|uniref:glucose 1-dehydrogenase n=1 Tax=Peribacillus psychrosaccharolyticus TaxID=1407 RepID=UPI003D2A5B7F
MMTQSIFNLSGQTALITGGGSGIGKIIAEALAEYGANIAVCSRKVENCVETAEYLIAKYGIQAKAYLCNVTSEEEISETVKRVIKEFGQIDILVNNSGATWGETVERMPIEAWNKVMNVNVTGTFMMSRAVGVHMLERGYGKIINIGSVAGIKAEPGDVLNAIGYSTSKAAVHHFTRDLAKKWAEHGIYVNAIAPGFFETKMTKHVLDKHQREIINRNPLKKLGDPNSLKGTALLLASHASDYITGQVIVVDGGSTL